MRLIDREQDLMDDHARLISELCDCEQERDEARAEVERMRKKLEELRDHERDGFRMFEFAVKLTRFSEKEKRLAHGTERHYWQGTCDACRKLTNIFRGEGAFMDLFSDLE